MTSSTSSSTVAWQPWSGDAFARAARERKPVLLSIGAVWCQACHDMDRTTWADAQVGALVNGCFVPVRVDSDRRPDINERYNLGGWPTTAFLTPEGDLLGGGTFVPVDRMPGVLARVTDAFRAHDGRPTAPRSIAGSDGSAPVAPVQELIARVFASFDRQCGGFGIEPKFPHAAPLQLAIDLFLESGDEALAEIVVATLRAMAEGELHDRVDGGFFRYAAARDWRRPHLEKLLESNAHLLGVYARGARVFGHRAFADVARRTIAYVDARLADPDGGYYGSEIAHREYYEAPDRTRVSPPPVDRAFYADANAAMAAGMLAAGRALEDEDLLRAALRSLERVLLACYRPGHGVAHYVDGAPQVRGLLADQIGMIHALLDAHETVESEPYLMMAQELAHYAVHTLADEAGAFLDRAPAADAIGLLREPRRPFVANCEAARALLRLARASGDEALAGCGRRALAAAAPFADAYGPLAAHYVLALRQGAAT